jgi:hypothetical protein
MMMVDGMLELDVDDVVVVWCVRDDVTLGDAWQKSEGVSEGRRRKVGREDML